MTLILSWQVMTYLNVQLISFEVVDLFIYLFFKYYVYYTRHLDYCGLI